MIENTPQNQERFLHQYHGQRVLYINSFHEKPLPVADEYVRHIYSENNNVIAELTSLSKISEEDAIYVASLAGWSEAEDDSEATCIHIGKKIAKNLATGVNTYDVDLLSCFEIKDYLISKGYAFDWNGVKVKTQIKWGWIQLKNN